MRMQLTPDAGSPAMARDFVRRALADSVSPEVVHDLQLVVSELVTNSVRHADLGPAGIITLTIACEDDVVRIQVRDGGLAFTPPPVETRPSREGGLGLHIVDQIAAAWGTEGSGSVWAEVPR